MLQSVQLVLVDFGEQELEQVLFKVIEFQKFKLTIFLQVGLKQWGLLAFLLI